jgi:GTP-binding protein HflX
MHDIYEPPIERAVLVGIQMSGRDRWTVEDSLAELKDLASTAGASVVASVIQKRDAPSAPTYIGKGKAAELNKVCQEQDANLVVFDDDLTPAQGRNLGEIVGKNIKLIDRTELILDIFAQRARTQEGKIQVELAQMQYMLPRLTGLWTHLSRQRGGVGCRGPGETQLEVDRRRVQEKITRLRRDLENVKKNRRIERSGRQRLHWPLVSIIGYTNSGKSTLMNALTRANVLAEDKLFATLDPTTRKLRLPNNQNILISDTVGFLRKLPHHLVESFSATLEEVVEADLLLHMVDVTHPQAREQIAAVDDVLHRIHATGKPMVIALNKIDRLSSAPAGELDGSPLDKFLREFHQAVPISAQTGQNVDLLLHEIANQLASYRVNVTLAIPHDRAKTIALVYQSGYVTARGVSDGNVVLQAQIPKVLAGELKPYVVDSDEDAAH